MSNKIVPLFPGRTASFSHVRDERVARLVGIGWSIERGSDYVTLDGPREESRVGWVLTVRQARMLAAALIHYADKLADEEWQRAHPTGRE